MAPDKPPRLTLARLFGLLGSDYAGERDAAGRMADALVRNTWFDVVLPPALPAPAVPSGHFGLLDGWPARWRAAAYVCLQAPTDLLTCVDRRFIQTIVRYEHRPSQKQLDWLARILGDILAAAGATP